MVTYAEYATATGNACIETLVALLIGALERRDETTQLAPLLDMMRRVAPSMATLTGRDIGSNDDSNNDDDDRGGGGARVAAAMTRLAARYARRSGALLRLIDATLRCAAPRATAHSDPTRLRCAALADTLLADLRLRLLLTACQSRHPGSSRPLSLCIFITSHYSNHYLWFCNIELEARVLAQLPGRHTSLTTALRSRVVSGGGGGGAGDASLDDRRLLRSIDALRTVPLQFTIDFCVIPCVSLLYWLLTLIHTTFDHR
jgi:hypothetical protein